VFKKFTEHYKLTRFFLETAIERKNICCIKSELMKVNQYQGVKFCFDSLQENTNILNTIYRYIFNEDDYKSQKSEKRQLVNNNQYSVKSFKKSQ
jgi:hypothetical protein